MYFEKLSGMVLARSPLQKKRLTRLIETQDDNYKHFCEELSERLLSHFITTKAEQVFACDSYLKMCRDFLHAQIRFKQSGIYPVAHAGDAKKEVYDNPSVMRYYMLGLLLSYMFWPNHYLLFEFFKKSISKIDLNGKKYLEIGGGHGLFVSEVVTGFPLASATVVDISATSIQTAKELLRAHQVDESDVKFIHSDFMNLEQTEEKYDFIVMGEVLEHVDDGEAFMKKAASLLNPAGAIFMTTAANSPALDHVLHFHNVQEIRDLLNKTGFEIVDEIVHAAEDVPEAQWEQELVTLNYGSLLKLAS